ncbi:MAG: OmpH family outer membrane protein [Nitrospiraceae bacterium]|nr:OmpH family outer membrane protein [Nitrospiraceae bacterium]
MKKIVSAVAVMMFLAAMAVGARTAMAASQGAGAKIGFVDLQRALNESNAGKAAKTELQALMTQMQKAIDKKIARTEALKAELGKQSLVLSPAAKKAKQAEIDKLTKETRDLINSSNVEMQKKRQMKEVAILKQIKSVIDDIGSKEHYLVILPADVILYSKGGSEVTDEVISRLNQSSPTAPAGKTQ